jgi:hypothetical protein
MDWTVCSRETERDYTWDNTHASHLVSEYAQELFSPAFEGSLTTSRVATLFCCHGVLSGVVLGVSADTLRKDFRNRPIRTMAFLRAEKPEEADLLARFFAECLRKPDAETIYNAESGVAKAVESLYQTKKLDDFMQFCRSLPTVNGGGVKLADRWAIPRGETADRSALVESLPALIGDNAPFLLALTDRLPTDVLASLGSMFDHAVVRIFSKATEKPEKLPEPASQKHRRAAAIGGAVLLVLFVAAIGTCSRRNGEANSSRGGADDGTSMSTNLQVIGGMVANGVTNAPSQEAAVTNAPLASQTGSIGPVASVTTNALMQKATVTNALSASQNGSGGFVAPATTNVPPQEAAATNSLNTRKRNTNNEQ